MYTLDNKFLEDVALGNMPENEKQNFFRFIFKQMTALMSDILEERMSNEAKNEYEAICAEDTETCLAWLAKNIPDYAEREDFKIMQYSVKPYGSIIGEYTLAKWLQVNHPDYLHLIDECFKKAKENIEKNKEQILAIANKNCPPPIAPQPANGLIKLDNNFLEEIGLGSLAEDRKQEVLQEIYRELEIAVGEKLTEGMSDDLLDEFGLFVDMDEEGMKEWFAEYLPNFKERDDYKQLRAANEDVPEIEVMSEYGAMKWLEKNRPDSPQVVASVLEEIKAEINENKHLILAKKAP